MIGHDLLSLAVGIVLGAVGCLTFLMRSSALSSDKDGSTATPNRRKQAVRSTLVVYEILACGLLTGALVAGDRGFLLMAVVVMLLATFALLMLWSGWESGR